MSSDPQPLPVTSALLRQWPLRNDFEDKESRGRLLVVGGSSSTPGAVLLAAEAALRVGAGKLQVATVASTAAALGVALPEALVEPLPETAAGTLDPRGLDRLRELVGSASAVVLGPGLRGIEETRDLVVALLPAIRGQLVLDALALAALTEDPTALHPMAERCVLTPNISELALTLGLDAVAADDLPAAVAELSRRTRAVVTSGGTASVTVAPDGRSWLDQAGGKGLGVSGSGDVLAGAVAGLLARGAEPAQSAVWGVHLHRRAGDRLAAEVGRLGFLARELPAQFPRVLTEIEV